MSQTIRRLVLAVFAAFAATTLVAACGDDPDRSGLGDWLEEGPDATDPEVERPAPDGEVTTTTSPDRSATHTREVATPPEIEVIDRGSAPHQELRLNLSAGDSQQIVIEITQARQLHVEGWGTGDEAEATYAIDVEVNVTAVNQGRAQIETTYSGVRLLNAGMATPEDLADFHAIADSVTGLTFYSEIDDRGITRVTETPRSFGEVSAGSSDDIVGAGQDVPEIPLPLDPVGPGARWRTLVGPHLADGTSTTITTEYHLQEVHDDRLVIDLVSTITTEAVTIDGWEYGATESINRGTVTWYLADLMPTGTIEGTAVYPFVSPDYGPDHPGEIRVRNRSAVSTRR